MLQSFIANHLALFIIIIILVIAILVLIALLIYKKMKNNTKFYLNKLDEYLKDMTIEDSNLLENYIARLNSISKKNTEYYDIYVEYQNKYDDLMNQDKDNILTKQKGLKERFGSEKISKGLVEQYKNFEKEIASFKNKATLLKNELKEFFKEADELRLRHSDLTDKYQQINKDIEKYSASLEICKLDLTYYLSDVSLCFDRYDDFIERAKYKEASNCLNQAEEMIYNVYGQVENIATYCNLVSTIIPSQLLDLIKKNDELEQLGYVVSYAKVYEFVENTNRLLDGVKNSFKRLCFADFEDISNEIQTKLTEINAYLDQEVSAKNELDSKYKIVSTTISKASEKFIETKRQFATMLEYYKLPSDLEERFNNFQDNATKLSGLKREYECYLVDERKNPATFMLKKVYEMENLAKLVEDDIAYFLGFFNDTKEHVEDMFNKVNEISKELVIQLGEILNAKAMQVYKKYLPLATTKLTLLKQTKNILTSKPIDLATLDETFSELVNGVKECSLNMHLELTNYQAVLKSIYYLNPLRSSFYEVNIKLDEVFDLFLKGEYAKAQSDINELLKQYHPVAFNQE